MTFVLPALRDDLKLKPGTADYEGAPTWSICDPLRNKYFRIGWLPFEILSRWSFGDPDKIANSVLEDTGLEVTIEDIVSLMNFMRANSLTLTSPSGDLNDYLKQYEASKSSWGKWLVHNYLFFRIPLVRPDRFLDATSFLVRPFYTSTFRYFCIIAGILGLYLVSRQWEEFINTFSYFFELNSLILLMLAILVIKSLHELGHAYTANRYGCRVASMGVAFLVLFPVFYTDTTDAWKLTSRKLRTNIAAAGILTELSIAAIATLLWAVLPDGTIRSIIFFAATSSWLTSLMFNLNPMMRFDGYYMIADSLGVENLQDRSFEFGRWKLRQILFGVQSPPPEHLPEDMQRFLIIFSWMVWIYRFFLFLGIAFLVYALFFKVLGLILFAIEIVWFILLPIFRELSRWWKMREQIVAMRRFYVSLTIFFVGLALFFIPWHDRVYFPGVLEINQRSVVYPPTPAKIQKVFVERGDYVKRGEPIISLHSPELDYKLREQIAQTTRIKLQVDRHAASADELKKLGVLFQELKHRQSAVQGLGEQQNVLMLRSPYAGKVLDMSDSLHQGRWVNTRVPIAIVGVQEDLHVKGLVEERDLSFLSVGNEAVFIPDDPLREKIAAVITEIDRADSSEFDEPYLASVFGGDIAVKREPSGKLVPEHSVYRVLLQLEGDYQLPNQVVTGTIRAKAVSRSLWQRLYVAVVSLWIRESSF